MSTRNPTGQSHVGGVAELGRRVSYAAPERLNAIRLSLLAPYAKIGGSLSNVSIDDIPLNHAKLYYLSMPSLEGPWEEQGSKY